MDGLRILIVEDDALLALLLGEVLKDMGHQVCGTAHSVALAVGSARHLRPGLMIVDERLGDGSGLEVVEAVLRVAWTPHIFVTGDPARVRRLAPRAVVLEKPYFETDLTGAINQAMTLAPTEPGRSGTAGRERQPSDCRARAGSDPSEERACQPEA